ncbi:BTAD domain-containing putative transcriptional regulator [Nocardiopsis sp. CC223A]|uniref:AfsR/SARP family transcriptional regulator n=1 Tax=Nocardiopsis sp. CC223A TaxID=3044051 RepID=UPI00278BC5EA|nr:BTAD domain-containing putative transcriptional regulator [Nocardiopsis sp. CC223A]
MGGPRQRCVLGALLVNLGREVTVDRLIGYLWSDEPPRTARSVIQVQVSHLRRLIPDRISTTAGGYVLDVDPESVDLYRFRRLRDEAAHAEPEVALELLDRALACWRGVPFSGIGSESLEHTVVSPLREEKWSAVLSWASCALEAGRNFEVVSRLTPLAGEEPFRERLHHLLITALWRDNEKARALAAYEDFRARLADELGVDPGPELMSLHTRILREDADQAQKPRPEPTESGFRYRVRNDLPRDLPDFTGRRDTLRRLEEVSLTDAGRAEVCVITGAGGEGKTTTAVRFGYEAAKRYPDGQLFIDLYGYTAGKEPLEPRAALGSLLRAVGVDPEEVPESLEERAALWRATLMGRKVLLVLDNAASYAQVSPLLSSSPGSLTLITSRNELSGLSGARFLSLGMFDEESSLELLSRVLGRDRVEAEEDRAREIARICGGLPLALRVIAGRMLSRPRWSFEHVVRRLNEQNRKFRELQVDGQSVETAIDLSYRSLDEDQRKAFLTLSLMIGNTIDLAGGSALFGTLVEDADDVLQEFVGVCLLDEPQGDVYRMHDLIRDFALERAQGEFGAEHVAEARTRLAEYYLATSQHAAGLLGPGVLEEEEKLKSGYRTELMRREDAEKWFHLHRDNLADTIDYFSASGNGEHAWRMAESVWRFYALHGQMELLIGSHQRLLQANDRQGNKRGRAVTLIGLGIAHYISGRFDESLGMLVEARDLLSELGDGRGSIRALANLGMVYERVGRLYESAEAIQGVIDHAKNLGDQRLEALQWGNLAVVRQSLGQYHEALHCAEQAETKAPEEDWEEAAVLVKRVMGEAKVALGEVDSGLADLGEAMETASRTGLVAGQIYIHNSLGIAYRAMQAWGEAVEAHRAALSLAEASGDRSGDAEILTDLGITHAEAGHHEEAAIALEKAHAIALERDERYTVARACLALGTLPAPTVAAARAEEFLRTAAEILTEVGSPDAERARAALADRFGG